jgi:O-antigen/teichoic acid export membrane protein
MTQRSEPAVADQHKLVDQPPLPEPTAPADSFIKRTLWVSAARCVSLALAFLLPFILARKLSTVEFGLYKQSFQILQTALSVLGLQVSGGIFYFLPRHPDKKAQVALNAVLFYALVGAAVAGWFALHPAWVTQVFQGDGLVPVIPLLGATILLWLVASAFESVMIADNEVRRASVTTVLLQLAKTALLVCAALWQGDIRTLVAWCIAACSCCTSTAVSGGSGGRWIGVCSAHSWPMPCPSASAPSRSVGSTICTTIS